MFSLSRTFWGNMLFVKLDNDKVLARYLLFKILCVTSGQGPRLKII